MPFGGCEVKILGFIVERFHRFARKYFLSEVHLAQCFSRQSFIAPTAQPVQ